MFEKIYQILVEFLGESKQNGYSKDNHQYQFNCPCCADENGGIPDNKYNLEVNLYIGKYNCWKCGDIDGTRGRISNLIKKYGTPTLYRMYRDEMEHLISSKLYDINLYDFKGDIGEENYVILPKTYRKINIETLKNKKLLAYLGKRKIDQNIINKFNIGYTTWDEEDYKMRNRIIIPSYDKFGDLNYWVGRDFTDFQKQKYMNCVFDKKQIIFQESLIDWYADIVLVEGAIDCIYAPNAIAMLGKSLTKDSELYKQIVKKCKGRIIIALDSDTDINETKRIYNLLNFGPLKNKIWFVRMDKFKDFGDVYEQGGKYNIAKTLQTIKQFEEIDLIW